MALVQRLNVHKRVGRVQDVMIQQTPCIYAFPMTESTWILLFKEEVGGGEGRRKKEKNKEIRKVWGKKF